MNISQEKRRGYLARIEPLLRERAYTVEDLTAAARAQLSIVRQIIRELHCREPGTERDQRRVFIESYHITTGARIGKIPRYRWVTAGQADSPTPTLAECHARASCADDAPRVHASTHNALMGALFGSRLPIS